MSRPFEHAAEHLAGGKDIHSPEIRNFFNLQMPRTDGNTGWPRGLACNHERIEIGKTKGERRTAAPMTFRILVVIGGLEPVRGPMAKMSG
jgi:hypothetical protein